MYFWTVEEQIKPSNHESTLKTLKKVKFIEIGE